MAIPSGSSYPKMATAQTTRTVPPPLHVKQGLIVTFSSASEETAYDNTGVPMSTSTSVHENKHHT